ncbi:hypothetical protein Fot_06886 [Forsythia ovata]|uniref:Uncharacterized protein n=1 Tax=Forsythia ovata TaxID=205694 RepID=A0ABD1WU93_9LAMI
MNVSIHQTHSPILNSYHAMQTPCTTTCRLVTIHAYATSDANLPSHLVAMSSSHGSLSENLKAHQLLTTMRTCEVRSVPLKHQMRPLRHARARDRARDAGADVGV